MEILDALRAGLESRYDRGELSDVEHEAKQLREALDELDRTANPYEPDPYDDWLANQDEIEQGNWK